jgi:hypothetical protein
MNVAIVLVGAALSAHRIVVAPARCKMQAVVCLLQSFDGLHIQVEYYRQKASRRSGIAAAPDLELFWVGKVFSPISIESGREFLELPIS